MVRRMSGHGHHRHDAQAIGCAVLTVSDTRTAADDGSGQKIQELLRAHGHRIEHYQILKDEPALILAAIAAVPAGAEAIIVNGGTGLARRDTTYEAVRGVLEKE